MRRIVGVVAALGALVACSSANALPSTAGVALLNDGYLYPSDSYADFFGGPLTASNIQSEVSADTFTTTFTAPGTLMLPGTDTPQLVLDLVASLSLLGEPAPKEGPSQSCTIGIGHSTCRNGGYYCFVGVTGGISPDAVTVRYRPGQRTSDSYPPRPCGYTVDGGRGNDTIDTRDGAWSHVICGGAVDRVRADFGDVVDPDCEVVTRG